MVPGIYGRQRKFQGPPISHWWDANVAQGLAYPEPEHMLPKDFEQPGKREEPRAKPRLDAGSSKGTPSKARNRMLGARKRTKVARYTCPLPEPPPFGLTRRGDGKRAVHDYGWNGLEKSQVALLEKLGLML